MCKDKYKNRLLSLQIEAIVFVIFQMFSQRREIIFSVLWYDLMNRHAVPSNPIAKQSLNALPF